MTSLLEFYADAKETLLNRCVKCGLCISQCRAVKISGQQFDNKSVQTNIINYLKGFEPLSKDSIQKCDMCMDCYGCLDIKCPINVNSKTINELIRFNREDKKSETSIDSVFSEQIRSAEENSTPEEFKAITTEKLIDSEYLFFPGCNIYSQPHLLRNSLKILDAIGKPYSFLPGIQNCCGSARGCMGDAQWAQESSESLVTSVESSEAKVLILWCPTCLCFMEDKIKQFYTPSFRCVSFGQYVYENIDKLNFLNKEKIRVTLHEPCKSAYMGIDMYVRQILNAIEGTELVEMAHHKENTMCCGCSAVDNAPEFGNYITDLRLKEATVTGCEIMIDVCHYCHLVFNNAIKNRHEKKPGFQIENYSEFIIRAMSKP